MEHHVPASRLTPGLACPERIHRQRDPLVPSRSLGICSPRRPQKEDLSHEETTQTNGWQGIEGCEELE
jgi:hypothetical protein